MHDFTLYTKTAGNRVDKGITLYADRGYQGIAALHADSRIPAERKCKEPLPSIDKILDLF
jgi:hypothetical protein